MPFRLEHITLAERIELGGTTVLFAGQYGLMTGLAEQYGTSRQFLYDLRGRTRSALERALGPGQLGRPAVDRRLVVDRVAVERAILVLHQVAGAAVRPIQECLGEILGVERCLGSIEAVLQEAARRALALAPVPPRPLQALADEVFAAGRPVLEVVDHASGLIAVLAPAAGRDETTWGCAWLDLIGRGVRLASLGADGAAGLAAGARAAGLPTPRLDHWHTLRDLGRIARALEAAAYRHLTRADRAERAAAAEQYRAEHGRRPRRGRPLRAPSDTTGVAAAVAAADDAVKRADGVAVVLEQVRDALPPVEARTGQLRRAAPVAAELGAAAALLRESGGRAAEAAALLDQRTAGLVAYLEDLEQALAGPRAALGAEPLTFLAWAWQHRHALGLRAAADAWPQAPELAGQVWTALDNAVRGTGMAENLNSRLAVQRAARRGLPPATLALFAAYHNHHVFRRGKRAGHSPLELAGLPSPHWLDALGFGPASSPTPATALEFPTGPPDTVNTLVA
jgi:hypothetical protein